MPAIGFTLRGFWFLCVGEGLLSWSFLTQLPVLPLIPDIALMEGLEQHLKQEALPNKTSFKNK